MYIYMYMYIYIVNCTDIQRGSQVLSVKHCLPVNRHPSGHNQFMPQTHMG